MSRWHKIEGIPDLPQKAFNRKGGYLTLEGSSSPQTSTSTTQNYSPEEAARRTQVMDEALSIYGTQAGTSNPYPGAQPVGFDPATTAAQNLAVQNAFGAQQSVDQINQGITYGLNGAMDVNNNPYLQQSVDAAVRPITQSYTDPTGVMAQIRTGAQDAGQFGSSRQGIAEGVAAGQYAQAVGDTSAQMYSDAYNKGQDTFAKTLAFAPQGMEAGMQPVNWLSGVGAQNENLAQEMANYDANAMSWAQNEPWYQVNNLANIVYGGGSSQATTSSTMPGQERSALSGAAGGAMMGSAFGPWGAVAGGLLGAIL